MNRAEKLADQLLKPINPSLFVLLGIYTVVWGLWIISPFWDVFTAAPLYATMASISTEYFWGALAIASGAVICYGAFSGHYNRLMLGAFVGFFHWFVIAILYLVSDWHNTGGITALTFATYSALVWLNLKVNKSHFTK